MLLNLLIIGYLAVIAYSSPINGLSARQVVIVPQASSSSSSPSGESMTRAIPLSAIIAISTILGLGIILTVLLQLRRWLRKRRERRAENLRATSLVSLTAEELAGSGRARDISSSNPRRGRGRQSRGRAMRRTESGRSVKTLPEYSKEAGDEELVLVRRTSGSLSDEEYVDQSNPNIRVETVEEGDEEEQDELVGTREVPITIRSASPSRSRSPHERSPSLGFDTSRAIHTAPPLGQSMEMLQSQSRGDAPSYLEAMSSHDPDAPRPVQVPGPRPSALQRTASGFRDLLTKPFAPGSFRSTTLEPTPSRQRAGSTSSMLLHPTTSRFSTASGSTGADYPSPWASSHSLLISSPLPQTAVRASFDGASMPKGGLTKEQMRFLSSSEAANLVGTRLDGVPSHRRRRSELSPQGSPGTPDSRGVSELDDTPPPSWEQLDGERRRSEAFDRRNLASAVELDHSGTASSIGQEGGGSGLGQDGPAEGDVADAGRAKGDT